MLRLEWDREAATLHGTGHAILHIIDGNNQTNLTLASGELSAGRLSYWPDTSDVTFRLEVFDAARHTDDSIRVAAGPATIPAEVATPAPPSPATQSRASAHRWARANSRDNPSAESEADVGSRLETVVHRPSPFSPPPKPAPAPNEAMAAPPPRPAASSAIGSASRLSPEPRIEVSAEAAPPSRWSRMVRHIPLVRRLKKQQQVTVPPTPIHEAQPSLSAAAQRNLTAEVPIDVRVYITESGNVDFAELMDTRSTTRHQDLADAAVFAARRWNFRPARLGEQDVPSEAILHFRFKPAEEGAR